jgi:hypothetical protein
MAFRRDAFDVGRGAMDENPMVHEAVAAGLNAIPIFGGALSMISKFIPFGKKKKKKKPPPVAPVQAPVGPSASEESSEEEESEEGSED